eukprot:gene19820-6960_t
MAITCPSLLWLELVQTESRNLQDIGNPGFETVPINPSFRYKPFIFSSSTTFRGGNPVWQSYMLPLPELFVDEVTIRLSEDTCNDAEVAHTWESASKLDQSAIVAAILPIDPNPLRCGKQLQSKVNCSDYFDRLYIFDLPSFLSIRSRKSAGRNLLNTETVPVLVHLTILFVISQDGQETHVRVYASTFAIRVPISLISSVRWSLVDAIELRSPRQILECKAEGSNRLFANSTFTETLSM